MSGMNVSSTRWHEVRTLGCVFVVEFCYMGMEMLASRLLSPFFGTTLSVWTAILSVVLASGAVGNMLGARLCREGKARPWRVAACLAVCGVSFACMYALSFPVCAAQMYLGIKGALVASIAMFAIPGIAFGYVNPMLVELYSDGQGKVGAASGVVSATMTVGGIFGTAVSGFLLVPVLGARDLSYLMGCVLLVLAVLVGAAPAIRARRIWPYAAAGALAMIAAVGMVFGVRVSQPLSSDGVDFWQDTEYGHVHVFDTDLYGRPSRILNVDGGYESAMYLEPGLEYELVFSYCNEVKDIAATKGTGRGVCLGGGAYSIPRALAHDGWDITCVEIDPGVTEIAREWFGLSDTEAVFSLDCVNDDGRVWLESNAGFGADFILNDTFAGNVPARTLTTVEAAQAAHACLAKDGIYVVNVIGTLECDRPSLLADEVEALRSVFKNVYVFGDGDEEDGRRDNYIVVATDDDAWQKSVTKKALEVKGGDVRPLTDDWCPVEWLVDQDRD